MYKLFSKTTKANFSKASAGIVLNEIKRIKKAHQNFCKQMRSLDKLHRDVHFVMLDLLMDTFIHAQHQGSPLSQLLCQ